jgi:hypothetical protein
VASDHVWLHSQGLQQAEKAHASSTEGRLGDVGLGEGFLARLLPLWAETGRRKNGGAEALWQTAGQYAVCQLKLLTYL